MWTRHKSAPIPLSTSFQLSVPNVEVLFKVLTCKRLECIMESTFHLNVILNIMIRAPIVTVRELKYPLLIRCRCSNRKMPPFPISTLLWAVKTKGQFPAWDAFTGNIIMVVLFISLGWIFVLNEWNYHDFLQVRRLLKGQDKHVLRGCVRRQLVFEPSLWRATGHI